MGFQAPTPKNPGVFERFRNSVFRTATPTGASSSVTGRPVAQGIPSAGTRIADRLRSFVTPTGSGTATTSSVTGRTMAQGIPRFGMNAGRLTQMGGKLLKGVGPSLAISLAAGAAERGFGEDTTAGKTASVVSSAATGAGIGGTIGSFFGGIGAVPGSIIGGLLGTGYGTYKALTRPSAPTDASDEFGGIDPSKFEWGRDKPFLEELDRVSKKFGIKKIDLITVMASETGTLDLNPAAKNPTSSATGLIQFMEETAGGLGTTTAALRTMSRAQQMTYVERYFDKVGLPKGADAGQIYAAIYLPGRRARANQNNGVLSRSGERYYNKNRILDKDYSGTITYGDLADQAKQKYTELARRSGTPPQFTDASAAGRNMITEGIQNPPMVVALNDGGGAPGFFNFNSTNIAGGGGGVPAGSRIPNLFVDESTIRNVLGYGSVRNA